MLKFLDSVQTDDGLLLHGSRTCLGPPCQTVFLLVHGTGGNFHQPGVLATFEEQAFAAGCDVCRINTRGHDGMASIPGSKGSVRGGATHEVISESVQDLSAWVRQLVEFTYRRVILVGHSMGGVKSILYAARKTLPSVAGVVAVSPPRFCHAWWMSHPRGEAFREAWTKAERLVAAGRGEELMPVAQPVPFVATAAAFLAKYGPHDDYDVVKLLPQVECPVLVLVGSKSAATSPAFDGLPAALADLATCRSNLSFEMVEGADTGYAGCDRVPFERAQAWLERLPGGVPHE